MKENIYEEIYSEYLYVKRRIADIREEKNELEAKEVVLQDVQSMLYGLLTSYDKQIVSEHLEDTHKEVKS